MKKKLLVIVGAGASLDFGMPSVKKVDQLFEEWSKTRFPLRNSDDKSLYSWIKEKLLSYIQQNPRNRINNIINFENLIFLIQNLERILNDEKWASFNNRLKPFIDICLMPEITILGKDQIADGDKLYYLHSFLVDQLLDYFREICKTIHEDKKNEFERLRVLFKNLRDDFEVGVINLNYDNVLLTAFPDLETGFNSVTGEFERSRIYNGNWNFCYHIHGSIHFDLRENKSEIHKIYWNSDLNSIFSQNSLGRGPVISSEGLHHLNSAIIAGFR